MLYHVDRDPLWHAQFVFTYRGNPITCINNTAWKNARKRAALTNVRVHDLKHTFGRRLRSAGISFEVRQDLLGHKSGRITTHYSAAELQNLLRAANSVCKKADQGLTLTLIRSRLDNNTRTIGAIHQSSTTGDLRVKKRRVSKELTY